MKAIFTDIIIPMISIFSAFLVGVLTIYYNLRLKKIESKIIKIEKSEDIKYTLLEAAKELYNKLNDIVRNHKRVLLYFNNLSTRLNKIKTMKDILSSPSNIYIINIFYHFARYFALIEITKKEYGFLSFATDKETKSFYLNLNRSVAIFQTNRLYHELSIRDDGKLLKYQGKILAGAQTLIGESLLLKHDNHYEYKSFYQFCENIIIDKNYLYCFLPLIDFFENLKVIKYIKKDMQNIDFRWAKILFFSYYLRQFIDKEDRQKVLKLLPELKDIFENFLNDNQILKIKFKDFENSR